MPADLWRHVVFIIEAESPWMAEHFTSSYTYAINERNLGTVFQIVSVANLDKVEV